MTDMKRVQNVSYLNLTDCICQGKKEQTQATTRQKSGVMGLERTRDDILSEHFMLLVKCRRTGIFADLTDQSTLVHT